MANPLLPVRGAFAESERALILERQREGIAAKARGVYTGRAPAPTAEFGVTRQTVHNYLHAPRRNDHDRSHRSPPHGRGSPAAFGLCLELLPDPVHILPTAIATGPPPRPRAPEKAYADTALHPPADYAVELSSSAPQNTEQPAQSTPPPHPTHSFTAPVR